MSPSRELLARSPRPPARAPRRSRRGRAVLADVDADRLAAERVERHLGDRRAPPCRVVAERVDVGRGVVRGDDDLGVERRPSLGARPCATMWRRICVGGKNGCSCVSRESGWERSITRRAIRLLLSGHLAGRPGRCGGRARRRSARPVSALARVASPTTPDAVMSRSMSIGTTTLGPACAHPVLAERRPLAARRPSRPRRGPRRRASRAPSRRAGRARARATSRPPRRGSSAPRRRRATSAARSHHWTRKTRRPVVSK